MFFTLHFTIKAGAQGFDSAKIYLVCMDRMFYIRIDRVDLEYMTDTVFCLKAPDADSLYAMFENRMKSNYIKTVSPSKNYIDTRMSIDLYKNGKVASNISTDSGKTLIIDDKMYGYKRSDLILLNAFIPDISQRLCVH